MKRLILSCLWGMVFIILGFSQTQEGRGTWYVTDSKGLTASHSKYPFGTRVRVTNLQNNRQVIVTIDNRIAESTDRIIDISKAAADNLEMNPRGATPVRLEVLARRQSDAVIAEETPEGDLPEEPDGTPIVEVQTDTPPDQSGSDASSRMVNQTIITFNGMPNYSTAPSATSFGGRQVLVGPEPVLTAQEVPAPAPVRPEPVFQPPEPVYVPQRSEPVFQSPAPAVASPQPMVMQPTIMQPVVVPPVVVPPVIASPVLAEPILAEPILAEPVLAEPVLAAPVLAEPVVTAPVTASPVMTEPIWSQAIPTEPVVTTPQTTPMIRSEPRVTQPIITEPVQTSPTYSAPIYTDPVPSARTQAPSSPQTVDPRFIQVLPRIPDPGSGRIYRLQVGAFTNELNAREAVFRLRELGFDPVYELYGGYCRVIITGVRAGDVSAVIQRVGTAGFGQIYIREER